MVTNASTMGRPPTSPLGTAPREGTAGIPVQGADRDLAATVHSFAARANQPGPSQASPSQAGTVQAGPSQAGPSQASPSQASPSPASQSPPLASADVNQSPACANPWIAVVDAWPCRREFVLNFLRSQAWRAEHILALSVDEILAERGEPRGGPALIVFSVGGLSITDPRVSRDFENLLERFDRVPIVVLSDRNEREEVRLALGAGARGFVSTLLDPQLLCAALSLVRVGGRFAPPELFDEWMIARDDAGGDAGDDEAAGEPMLPQYNELTPRQTHVLQLLQEGFPNKVIASKLGMTESTVKVHVRQIMRRLGAKNRTEAALLAQRLAPLRKTAC